jgi:glycosyltransferase involved in cell wall biosynthesis
VTTHDPDRSPPDVTVVIPVYNAMPYLRRCLDSVLGQTIGLDRLQVITVDDGSTDGGGRLLDQVAAARPETFHVLHQPNSGGPALPCNRGLALAAGRWVFFLGADDHLSPTALERLVSQGDAWDSDVIFGTMRGENGRFVDQRIYRRTRRDITFLDSALPYALSTTKLFRRSLLEEHRNRFALDLRVGSDQPFTVEALTRARRVAVLNDQVYYHAVKGADASNITYTMDWRTRLTDIADVMAHIADVTGPGPVRDAVYTRHFTWEISKLLGRDLPTLPDAEQVDLLARVTSVFELYDTAGLDARLGPRTRLRLRLAQTGQLDLLRRVVGYQATHRRPPLVIRDGVAHLWSPGFGTASVQSDWYVFTPGKPASYLAASVALTDADLGDDELALAGRIGLGTDRADGLRLVLLPLPDDRGKVPGPRVATDDADPPQEVAVELTATEDGQASGFAVRLPLLPALRTGSDDQPRRRFSVRLRVPVADGYLDLPVRAEPADQQRTMGCALRAWSTTLRSDRTGALELSADRLPAGHALRTWAGRRRRALTVRLRTPRTRTQPPSSRGEQ